jgi:hypothetical protein
MDWQPSEPVAFAAAVSSFAAARATHLASQSTFALSCRTLATTISEEAKAQGNEVATRAEFSLFFVKVLLATPALAAAYTELERAAFARFLTPAHARRGVKLSEDERRSGLGLGRESTARFFNSKSVTHSAPPKPRAQAMRTRFSTKWLDKPAPNFDSMFVYVP